MTFEARLRAVIGDSTIDEFAAVLGETPQRVKDVLRGKQKPPADLLIKLQMKCGVDLNWLLVDGDAPMPMQQLSAREAALLDNYRAAAEDGRKAIEQTSVAVKKRPTPGELKPGELKARKAA
ncbi:MAG: helix-turn-helix transcriptional regulator [Ramlibacter sp.]|nr:helix-turn-helix transcriptional regulator [Ramlibacter sp.]